MGQNKQINNGRTSRSTPLVYSEKRKTDSVVGDLIVVGGLIGDRIVVGDLIVHEKRRTRLRQASAIRTNTLLYHLLEKTSTH